MTRAERIRKFPKTGWRNVLARHLVALTKRPAPTSFLDYRTQTALHLPFSGEWYVDWGGRSAALNYHVEAPDQRFAYDFLMLARGRSGQSYRSTGATNSDYYCFGQPIFAPADGVVVHAENESLDNPPGEVIRKQPAGNYVVIDHGSGEFSFLAHLRQDTLAVRTGDPVHSGRLLGECGNSGHSSEPHLHYHLQNTAVAFRGQGLPAFFVEYLANGKPVPCGEPVAGRIVRSQLEISDESVGGE